MEGKFQRHVEDLGLVGSEGLVALVRYDMRFRDPKCSEGLALPRPEIKYIKIVPWQTCVASTSII